MEAPKYPSAYRERWYVLVLTAILGVSAAAGISAVLPRTYESTATLFLTVESPESSLVERSQFAVARVKSYPELVQSPRVLRATISELGLDMDPRDLAKRVSASNPRDTVLLTVTATASDPVLAARIADAVALNVAELVGQLEDDVELELTLPAVEPASPASPQVVVLLGLGLFAGLAVGGILVAVLGQFDPRVRSVRDVRRLSGLPVVAQLPPAATRPGRASSASVESAARTLLVNERLLTGDRHPRLVVLVPAGRMPERVLRGAATTIARAAVSAGRTAVVVSADAPQPGRLRAALDGLRGRLPLRRAEPVAIDTVSLPSPLDTERGTELPRLVAAAVAHHDVVVLVADARADVFAFPRLTGAEVMVVADRRRTTRAWLVDTVTSLEFAGTRALGVLFVDVGLRGRVDLPATWTEADRVELPAVAVKAAPRKPRAPRKRRPAATAVSSPSDAEEHVAHRSPTAPESEDPPGVERARDREHDDAGDVSGESTLPGLDATFDDAEVREPEPEPEPV